MFVKIINKLLFHFKFIKCNRTETLNKTSSMICSETVKYILEFLNT